MGRFRDSKQITCWLTPGKEEHDIILGWVDFWRDAKANVSAKIQLGMLLVIAIESGSIDQFLMRIPVPFYKALSEHFSPPAGYYVPIRQPELSVPIAAPEFQPESLFAEEEQAGKTERIDHVKIDRSEFADNAADLYDDLY